MNAKELREKRANLNEQAKALLNKASEEKRDMTAEETKQFDALHNDMDSLKGQIERIERQEAADKELREKQAAIVGAAGVANPGQAGGADNRDDEDPETVKEKRTQAFRGYIRNGMNALPPEQRQMLVDMQAQLPPEARALAAGLDTAGGYTCPEDFVAQLETAMKAFSGVRQTRATILNTASGNDMPWPTSNDTSNEGEQVGENQQVTEQDIEFGAVTLRAYMYSSKMIRVSYQFLQDTGIAGIEGWIAARGGERIGRATGRKYITGTGNNQPLGLAEGTERGKQGSTQTQFKWEEMVDMEHSIDPAYRPQAEWLIGDKTLRNVKKQKDGEGRPLWVPGVAVREPDTILGYPYAVDQYIPDPAASAITAYFGDFSKFILRDVTSMQMLRLTERYADYLQVAFLLFSRHDSVILDAGTHPIKHFQQGA